VHEDRDCEPAKCRSAQFFRKNGGPKRIHIRATELFWISNTQKSQFSHAVQRFPGRLAVGFPRVSVRLHLICHEAAKLIAKHFVLMA